MILHRKIRFRDLHFKNGKTLFRLQNIYLILNPFNILPYRLENKLNEKTEAGIKNIKKYCRSKKLVVYLIFVLNNIHCICLLLCVYVFNDHPAYRWDEDELA